MQRRDTIRLLASAALAGALSSCARARPNGFIDYSLIEGCEGYESLRDLSVEYNNKLSKGEVKNDKDECARYIFDKLKEKTPEGEPVLTLTSASYATKGLVVTGMVIEIKTYEAFENLTAQILTNNLQIFKKPPAGSLPVVREGNSCRAAN